jgi:hypothetical protein
MKARRLAALLTATVAVAVPAITGCTPLPGAPACSLLPDNNVWHADVSHLPVNRHSAAWLASTRAGSGLRIHPDFGGPYGIPYTTVAGSHPKVNVRFQYAGESDRGPYPLGSDIPIEGGSDRHALVVDRDTCTLYETYATARSGSGWTGGQRRDLQPAVQRPSSRRLDVS